MSNVIKLKTKNATVKNVLSNSLDRHEEFETVVVIATKEDGSFVVGYSNQSLTDIAYTAMRFNTYVSDILED